MTQVTEEKVVETDTQSTPKPPIIEDGQIHCYNPRTGELIQKIAVTNVDELPKIVENAKKAQKEWWALGFKGRQRKLQNAAQYLIDNMDAISEELGRENGKTPFEAMLMEILSCIDFLNWFGKVAKKTLKDRSISLHFNPLARSYISYSPVGVVGVIAPWNYPMITPISDIAPALAAGNAVIFKPSEYSSGSGKIIMRMFKEAGLPENTVQAIYGGGAVGAALVTSGVNHVGFTGSTATGKKVMATAAEKLVPVTLELGGKDPAIVCPDANIDRTVDGILWGGFSNMGQTCASVERVYVHKSIYNKFRDKLVERAKILNIDPTSDASQFGSMNNALQAGKVNDQIDDAKAKGAKVAFELSTPDNKGFYAAPTILENVTEDMSVYCDETFGPIIPLYSYENEADVVKMCNDSPYGLTASVWTESKRTGDRLAQELHAGVVTVNDHMITPGFAEAPWGGVKESGIGRIKSHDALRNYSESKYVYHDHWATRVKAWRFPYTPNKAKLLKNLAVAMNDKSTFKRIGALMRVLPTFIFGFGDDEQSPKTSGSQDSTDKKD